MTIVPDSIEPIVGWRGWRLQDGALASCHHGGVWPGGTELEAKCLKTPREKSWQPEGIEAALDSGLPLSVGWEEATDEDGYSAVPRPPRVELPVGMAYVWRERPLHAAPGPKCSCGIYAAANPEGCIDYPISVLGRVALWGEVVPGEKGWRAQYAYPLELFVLEEKPEKKVSNALVFSFAMWSPYTGETFPPERDVEHRLSERYGVPTRRVKAWTAIEKVATA